MKRTRAMKFDPSSRALLSALLREIDGWSVVEREQGRAIVLPLIEQGGVVEAPLELELGVGRLALGQPCWRGSGAATPLSSAELIARLRDNGTPGVNSASRWTTTTLVEKAFIFNPNN